MDNRGFESVEQMNEVMIEKWNKKVHAHDEVIILGQYGLLSRHFWTKHTAAKLLDSGV